MTIEEAQLLASLADSIGTFGVMLLWVWAERRDAKEATEQLRGLQEKITERALRDEDE